MPTTHREKRQRLHSRVRRKVTGSSERPRLCVFFSGRHINAQVIDDSRGLTLVSVSTTEKDLRAQNLRPNVDHAAKVGQIVAERAKEKNINRVVFDRGGFTYHGKVKALADAAREAGLEF